MIGQLRSRYDSEDTDKKEETFVQDWIKCEGIALDVEESMNDLFAMYEYYLLAANPKKSLYSELENQFRTKDPLCVISDFKAFISSYKGNICDSKSPVDYSFFYLKWSIYWKTIITTAWHSGYPDIEELKTTVRRYFYLFWIAGFTLSRIKQTSFNLIKGLKAKKLINEIKQELEKSIAENKVQERVERALEGDIYQETWCKPLLTLIEYNQTDKPDFIELEDRSIHVEHILPQNFEKEYDWTHIIEDEKDGEGLVNTLGNLTLLSGKKNIEARNDSFENKVSIYQGKGKHGTSDDKITSFRITQQIFDDFTQKKFERWDFDTINTRKKSLLEEIEQILQIDLKNIIEVGI